MARQDTCMKHLTRPALTLAAVLASIPGALAGKADVIDAKASKAADGTYNISVTVASDDTGWDKYADRWEVVAPDGTVLATRILAHPHETEQPFTREQSGINIPPGISKVIIRAHDKVEGFGGKELTINLGKP
jgi:hypothetical protein